MKVKLVRKSSLNNSILDFHKPYTLKGFSPVKPSEEVQCHGIQLYSNYHFDCNQW